MFKSMKTLLSTATPFVSSRFTQTLQMFIVMAMLAQLGHTVLAAGIFMTMLRVIVFLICASPLFAIGSIAGRVMGEKKTNEIPKLLMQGSIIGLILGIPMMILFALITPIMQLLHQPAAIIPYVATYFHILIFSVPAIMLSMVWRQVLISLGYKKSMTNVTIFGLLLTVFFCYVLIFGHFGFAAHGVAGAAIALVISMWTSAIIRFLALLHAHKTKLSLSLQRMKNFMYGKLILKIGMPICLQLSSEMFSVLLIILMVGWLGETSLAASQIANEYMMFAIVPIFGLSEATAMTVGKAYGEKKLTAIKSLANSSMLSSVVITIFIALVFAIFHYQLADLFIHFDKPGAMPIYHLAMLLLGIRIFGMLFDGVSDVLSGAMRGLYKPAYPMFVSMIAVWCISLPLAALLGFYFGFGLIGIAIAGLIANFLACIAMVVGMFTRGFKQLEIC